MLWSTVATAFSLSLHLSHTASTCDAWRRAGELVLFCGPTGLRPGGWQALWAISSTKDRATSLLVGWMNPGTLLPSVVCSLRQASCARSHGNQLFVGHYARHFIAAPILLRQRLTASGALLATSISYFGIVIIATRGAILGHSTFAQPLGRRVWRSLSTLHLESVLGHLIPVCRWILR